MHSIITFRQPISFLLQLFFPVILISVLLLLKLAIPEGNHDICQVILTILNTISIILFIFQSSEPEPHQALDCWPVFSRICATFRMTAMTLKILRFVDRMKIFRIIKFVYLLHFQDIPSYPGSKLGLIVQHLEPLIYNDTLKEFNENVPALLALVNSSSQAMLSRSIWNFQKFGIHFGKTEYI